MLKTQCTKTLKSSTLHAPKFDRAQITCNIIYFVLSLFIASKGIYGKFYPFGVSLISSVPYSGSLFTGFGCAAGYLISSNIKYSIKYIAAIILICVIRWALKELKLEHYKIYSPILCSTVLFLISIPVYVNDGFSSLTLFNNFLESLFAGIYSYFFKESIYILVNCAFSKFKTDVLIKNPKDLMIFCVSFFTIMFSLIDFKIGPISLGITLAICAVMLLIRNGGFFNGVIGAVILEFIFEFRVNPGDYILNYCNFIFLPICVLILEIFSKCSKFQFSLLYVLLNLILKLNLVHVIGTKNVLISLYETILASALFIVIPNYLGKRLINLNSLENNSKNLNSDNIQKYISLRLNSLANSFFNIGSSVDIVANNSKESENVNNKFDEIISSVKTHICRDCTLNAFCWNVRRNETQTYLKDLFNGTCNEYSQTKLKERCSKIENIKSYAEILENENNIKATAKKRINEIKDFMVEQFKDISSVLKEVSNNLGSICSFRADVSNRVTEILNEFDIFAVNVFCSEIQGDKLSLEVCINLKDNEKFKELNIQNILEKEFRKKFKKPILKETLKDKLIYIIAQTPKYKVDLSVSQHVCKNNNFCGDNFKYFQTEDGKLILILSDGMGTGVRAAVEGAMACEIMSTLIRCKIDFKVALKITNTTLLMNPNEESLATLDVISIDLYTGEATFIKAGAPVTLIKSKGEVQKLDETSLPVGILKNINYYFKKAVLSGNDKILVMSDGAIYPNDDWITERLNTWQHEPAKELADYVVKKSLEHRKAENDDDITVVALEIMEVY